MPNPRKIDDFFNSQIADEQIDAVAKAHSRGIVLLKTGLPILAALLGLSILLFPVIKKDLKEFAIDLVIPDGDIKQMNAENTVLYFTDTKGRVNNFEAKSIKETSVGSEVYNLYKPVASMPIGDNQEYLNITSSSGIYDRQKNLLQLPHKVDLFYSRGFNIETRNFFFDINKSFGYSKKPVIGYGFLGNLNSEGVEISLNKHIITFVGKTSIVIDENNLKKENR